uniref:Cytochrome P450 n=1 Tax=Strigamia maritima TaxID=126957 RepID=T1JEV8_STRMM
MIFTSSLRRLASIPGPRELPFLGHAHLFSPLGPYKLNRLVDAHADLHKRYGRVVQLRLGMPFVLLFNPDDIETMYRWEGTWPKRPLFEVLGHYRASRPDKYKHMGLVTENGPKWLSLRKHVQILLRFPTVHSYFESQELIAGDFIEYLDRLREKNGRVRNLLPHLYLYAQESIGFVCFGERLGCFEKQSKNALVLAENVTQTLDAMGKTMLSLPWWKIVKTASYRKLEQTQDYLWQCSVTHMEKAKRNVRNSDKHVFLKNLFESDLHPLDVSLLVNELFQGGIDATATAIIMTLHYLANNKECQEKLREEVNKIKTPKQLDNCQYLHATVRESLRLSPTAVASARILPRDVIINNHHLPANSILLGCHPVICYQPQFFPDPLRFNPNRWLREPSKTLPHPFASLPFGMGLRMCPGRRLAEQEIKLFLTKLIQQYRIEPVNPAPVGMVMRLNLTPDRPLDFDFHCIK